MKLSEIKTIYRFLIIISAVWIVIALVKIDPWQKSLKWGGRHSNWVDFISIGIFPVILIWGFIWIFQGFYKNRSFDKKEINLKKVTNRLAILIASVVLIPAFFTFKENYIENNTELRQLVSYGQLENGQLWGWDGDYYYPLIKVGERKDTGKKIGAISSDFPGAAQIGNSTLLEGELVYILTIESHEIDLSGKYVHLASEYYPIYIGPKPIEYISVSLLLAIFLSIFLYITFRLIAYSFIWIRGGYFGR